MEPGHKQEAFVVRLLPGGEFPWQGSVAAPGRTEPKTFCSSTELLRLIDRSMQEDPHPQREVREA